MWIFAGVLKLICVCHSGPPVCLSFLWAFTLPGFTGLYRMQSEWARMDSSEVCCITSSWSTFWHIYVVLTSFSGRWQQLPLSSLGQMPPRAGGCTTSAIAPVWMQWPQDQSHGPFLRPVACVMEQTMLCGSAGLLTCPVTAGLAAGSSSGHAAFLQLFRACFSHCREWMYVGNCSLPLSTS